MSYKLFQYFFQLFNFRKTAGLTNEQAEIIKGIRRLVGYPIKNTSIYFTALTHRSTLEIHPENSKSNERLEFLGDSILGFIVGKYLFEKFPHQNEGFLTKYRSNLVNKIALYQAAQQMGLKEYLQYNKKYIKDNSDGLKTILADSVEAFIAAIYFDAGINVVEKFVHKWIILPHFQEEDHFVDSNYKGQLLEYSHSMKYPQPNYEVVKEVGPPHAKYYYVKVTAGSALYGEGKGKSKKIAEQNAAQNALSKSKNNG